MMSIGVSLPSMQNIPIRMWQMHIKISPITKRVLLLNRFRKYIAKKAPITEPNPIRTDPVLGVIAEFSVNMSERIVLLYRFIALYPFISWNTMTMTKIQVDTL